MVGSVLAYWNIFTRSMKLLWQTDKSSFGLYYKTNKLTDPIVINFAVEYM